MSQSRAMRCFALNQNDIAVGFGLCVESKSFGSTPADVPKASDPLANFFRRKMTDSFQRV